MDKNEYLDFVMKEQPPIIDNVIKDYVITNQTEDYDPCKYCSNHPRNGGSGICHCILGLPRVTC